MGDCFEVISTFASGSIDLIVTDPPYEVCCVGGGSVNSVKNLSKSYLSPKNVTDKKLYQHPTIKPLDITEKIIRNSSEEGQMVLDPFMGSGTTGVACSRLNRNFIGIECEEKWFNIAKNRILNGKERIIKP